MPLLVDIYASAQVMEMPSCSVFWFVLKLLCWILHAVTHLASLYAWP